MNSLYPPSEFDVPPEHALLVVDMRKYSQMPEAKMSLVRDDLDDILKTVFLESGLAEVHPAAGAERDTGDGVIFVLPARDLARLIDPLLGNLNKALLRYDRARLASAPPIHLRASVHVGPLTADYRGDAINEACRLVNCTAVREATEVAVQRGEFLAAAVSEGAFRRTVHAGRTRDLAKEHFLRAVAQVKDKPEFNEPCRILVPGVSPEAVQPHISDRVEAPGLASTHSTPSSSRERSSAPVAQASGGGIQINGSVHGNAISGPIQNLRMDYGPR
ncbi:hypothetical protein ACWGIB_04970 [Streptomyces xiamenensis]